MILALDGPAEQTKLSAVGTATPVEVKVNASPFEGRQVLTMQGTGKYYIYFGDGGAAPNAATVSANGFTAFKDAMVSVEAGPKQDVYVLAVTGTVDIVIAERG